LQDAGSNPAVSNPFLSMGKASPLQGCSAAVAGNSHNPYCIKITGHMQDSSV